MWEYRLSTIEGGGVNELYVTMEVWDRPDDQVSFPDRLWHREVSVIAPMGDTDHPAQMKELLISLVEHL